MDFHTLSRRDLQALCKRNKIPANMTNVAMADALGALKTVEGLEEVLAHSEADSLNTPARSIADASAYRASNRQRTLKEDTATSKLTRTRQTARKDVIETAPPSSVQQAYSTRRSTRLLEKQMCQLTLKENEDVVDAKAVMEKDSQNMQRQFSQDMDSSLVDKNFSDESNCTEEATEEPTIAEVLVKNVLLENPEQSSIEPSVMLNNNAGGVETPIIIVEDSINDKDDKDGDEVLDQPMQDAITVVDAAQDVVSKPDTMIEDEFVFASESKATEITVAPVCQPISSFSVVDAAQDAVPKPETMIEDEFVFASESKPIEIAVAPVCQPMQDGPILEDELKPKENAVAAFVAETKKAIDATGVMEDDAEEVEQRKALQVQAPESADDDEFDFLSESSDSESDDSEETDQSEVDNNTPEPLSNGDKSANRSSSKKSPSARQAVQAKFDISSRLQDENIVAVATPKTPIEKKSLRQLKKMVREKKQKAEAKRPLQARAENAENVI